jgi:hypothetical protein
MDHAHWAFMHMSRKRMSRNPRRVTHRFTDYLGKGATRPPKSKPRPKTLPIGRLTLCFEVSAVVVPDPFRTSRKPVKAASSSATGDALRRCYVKLAVENGARVVTGGKRLARLGKGYCFGPTVLDVQDNSNLPGE